MPFLGYKPLISSMATHAISSVSAVDANPTALLYGNKKVEVKSMAGTVTHLGLSTKKLFDYLLLLLTKYNRNDGDWNNETVWFTLQDFMQVMECADDRKAKARCLQTLLEDICKLGVIQLRQEDNPEWFGLIDRCHLLCASGVKTIKKELIAGRACFAVSFSKDLLEHLKEFRFIVPFAMQLFSIAGRNENAYAIAKRLILHYSINGGKFANGTKFAKKRERRIKVSTLLPCCPALNNANAGNVRIEFEQALNLLWETKYRYEPFITWVYLVDDQTYLPDTVSKMRMRHDKWQNLVIVFTINGLERGVKYTANYELDSAYKLFGSVDGTDVKNLLLDNGKVNTDLL